MRRSTKAFPELARFATDAEAEAALIRVHKMRAGWRWAAAIPLIFAPCMLGLYALSLALLKLFAIFHLRPPVQAWVLLTALPAAIAAVAAPLIVYFAMRRRLRTALRVILQEKGVPVCIGCGYDCRGLEEPRCPECGRAFDAKLLKSHSDLGASDPRQARCNPA